VSSQLKQSVLHASAAGDAVHGVDGHALCQSCARVPQPLP
jgi:hypothetical protein